MEDREERWSDFLLTEMFMWKEGASGGGKKKYIFKFGVSSRDSAFDSFVKCPHLSIFFPESP